MHNIIHEDNLVCPAFKIFTSIAEPSQIIIVMERISTQPSGKSAATNGKCKCRYVKLSEQVSTKHVNPKRAYIEDLHVLQELEPQTVFTIC